MKITYSTILILLVTLNLNSQVTFENGYFIDNNGRRVECLIENRGWDKNPMQIGYKINPESEPKILTTTSAKEVVIYGKFKFISRLVEVNSASKNLKRLSTTEKFELEQQQLFLKVLLEGKANLYSFNSNEYTNFFIKKENSAIELLKYKKYSSDQQQIKTNQEYKRQLFKTFKDADISIEKVRKTEYKADDLIELFETYNTSQNSVSKVYEKGEKGKFYFGIQPSISSSSLSIDFEPGSDAIGSAQFDAEYDNTLVFKIGLELEYILGVGQNKWSVFIAPSYQKFSSTTIATNPAPGNIPITVNAQYTSLEIPLGARHYIYVSNKSKFLIEAGLLFDFPISDSYVSYDLPLQSNFIRDDISQSFNPFFGIGFNFDHKANVIVRYQVARDILNDTNRFEGKFSSLSLLLTYYLPL